MSIKSIVDQLKEYSDILDQGELDPDQIARMTELSRDLYERLVIFKYKTFELGVAQEEEKPAGEEEISQVSEPSEDMTEPEVPSNQISLIDSIEEIKEMEQSLNESFSSVKSPTLKEKIVGTPISDLRAAISINQKFKFISELFEDDAQAFEKSVETINGYTSYIEADDYMENNLKPRYGWETNSASAKEFADLVSRRFL
jgi:hypothetical protein